MLLLIAETTLHGSRAQSSDYASGSAEVSVFILWSGSLAGETCGDALFGAILSVLVVGIYCVRTHTFGIDAGQLFMIFNAFLEPYALVEGLERMMLDE